MLYYKKKPHLIQPNPNIQANYSSLITAKDILFKIILYEIVYYTTHLKCSSGMLFQPLCFVFWHKQLFAWT